MKYPFLLLTVFTVLITTRGWSQSLPAQQFQKEAEAPAEKNILDVRTPDEYTAGHIAGAVNINWLDSSFSRKALLLPKELPVYVYCLSGGRSAKAAAYLRSKGFKQVYEMEGGMLKWRAAQLPEEKTAGGKGLFFSKADFEKALQTDKLVLVDFYAAWCGPCKKMEPYLKEIAHEKAATVSVLRIDIDKNPELANTLKIDALPVLHIYKNGKLQWSHLGYITKKKVLTKLQ
ncbi:thioredoxin domain-containing protein [Niabella drilacis]|uniref:Thioredoxin n=1 Tax=Niabella drilacis (strain DSM 25811 / CCM 8410 / CCUG 62505 / LMG 26954 / E90) TaxID=1285928 RepID=A0A1G6YBD9_NIADE|nr:thioredoxin domain-containing protein [Niabella drilacis]SDD86905.1 thioredoxin [Niabella drilacis]